jgi:hypothetical protein
VNFFIAIVEGRIPTLVFNPPRSLASKCQPLLLVIAETRTFIKLKNHLLHPTVSIPVGGNSKANSVNVSYTSSY